MTQIFSKKNDAGQIDKYLDIKMYFWHVLHDKYLKSFSLTYIHEVTCISTKNLGHVKCLKVICDLLKRVMAKMEFNFAFFNKFHIVIQCKISFQWVSIVQCNIEDYIEDHD